MRIGIRAEDKHRWEARVPLVPRHVAEMISANRLNVSVQPSTIRAFADDEFRKAGAKVSPDLSGCDVVFGIKEIPTTQLLSGKTLAFFSHTIKGQRDNMPMLRRMMELGCTLIDYEKIVDDRGRRLVYFGNFAGLAGMIDTLWALGQRLLAEGVESPFARVQPAHRYADVAHARREIGDVAERIKRDGLPDAIQPLVCGFAGYGQVSRGAQEIYDLLPTKEVSPDDLASIGPAPKTCYKVVFREEHLVEPIDGAVSFELQDYYDYPERYRSRFDSHLQHLTLLINGIYWEARYPRLVTIARLRELFGRSGHRPRLRVIGDISCDVNGAMECTVRATTPDAPVYVYDPVTGEACEGVTGNGPVVLAVDTLPCELPVDSSTAFSGLLVPWVPAIAGADYRSSITASGLPPEIVRATILYRGTLTETYRYLDEVVRSVG